MPSTTCARCGHPINYEVEREGQETICPGCQNIALLVPEGPPQPDYDPLAPVVAAAGPAPPVPSESDTAPPPPLPVSGERPPPIAGPVTKPVVGITIIAGPNGAPSAGLKKPTSRITTLQLCAIAGVTVMLAIGGLIVVLSPDDFGDRETIESAPGQNADGPAAVEAVAMKFIGKFLRSSPSATFGPLKTVLQDDRSWFVAGTVRSSATFESETPRNWSIVMVRQGNESWQRMYMNMDGKEVGDRTLTPAGRQEMVNLARARLGKAADDARRQAELARLAVIEMERQEKRREEAAARVVSEKARKASETEARVVAMQIKRAKSGSAVARYDLGVRYLEGNGVGMDRAEALRLLGLSAAQGNRDAIKKLKEVKAGN